MAYELREKQGSLFKNDRKRKDNDPDYRGKCLIGGQLYYIGAWLKTSPKSGVKLMSLGFTIPHENTSDSTGYDTASVQTQDEDLPF